MEVYSVGNLLGETVESQIFGYQKEYLNNKVTVKEEKIDSDNDGISDGYEKRDTKTNPLNSDSDGDGFLDGFEVMLLNSNPLQYTNNNDSDSDGINDLQEQQIRSNPLNKDSDFDGFDDKNDQEILKSAYIKHDKNIEIQNLCNNKFDYVYKYIDSDNNYVQEVVNKISNKIKYIAVENEEKWFAYDLYGNNIAIIRMHDGNQSIDSFYYQNLGNNKQVVTQYILDNLNYSILYDDAGNIVRQNVIDYNSNTRTTRYI